MEPPFHLVLTASLPHLGGAFSMPDLGRKGAGALGRKSRCIVGSPVAAESNLNESGALLRTRVVLLALGSGPARYGAVGEAAVCGAGMAYNKIPPRWLNCPRRGQPVAGTREGSAGGFESHGSGRAWGTPRAAERVRGSRKAEE